MPDFSRALPVADSGNRELYISLGCAAWTAMIAARFYGYKPVVQINAGSNPCLVEISLQKDEFAEQWIKAGMAFQHFALTATKLGLSLSFLNAPCQIPQVRDKMISDSGLDGAYPQLLIRF